MTTVAERIRQARESRQKKSRAQERIAQARERRAQLGKSQSEEPAGPWPSAMPTLRSKERIMSKTDALINGLLMGLGPEAQGGAQALWDTFAGGDPGPGLGANYDKRLAEERKSLAGERKAAPIESAVLEAVGTLPAMAVTAPLAAAPYAAPLARALVNAGVGGAGGAIYGFNDGEGGFEKRAVNATAPGAIGAAAGLASPLVGNLAGKVGEKIARKHAARAGGIPNKKGLVEVLQTVTDLDLKGGKVPARNTGMWADQGSAARSALDTAMEQTGGGLTDRAVVGPADNFIQRLFRPKVGTTAGQARAKIEERSLKAMQDMKFGIDEIMGQPIGIKELERRLRGDEWTEPLDVLEVPPEAANPSSPIRKAYDEAYGTSIDYYSEAGEELESFIKNRIRPQAVRDAMILMRDRGRQSNQLKATFHNEGTPYEYVEFEVLPNVEQLDYIKRGLDNIARGGDGKGQLGGQTPLGQSAATNAKILRNMLGEQVPAYRKALGLAARPRQAREAMVLGRKALLDEEMTADELAAAMRTMNDEAKQFLRQGAREGLDTTMRRAKDAMLPDRAVENFVSRTDLGDPETRRMLGHLSSQEMRDKMRLVLGEKDAKTLFTKFDELMNSLELEGSSRHSVRRFMQDKIMEEETNNLLEMLFQGNPMKAAGQVMGRSVGLHDLNNTKLTSELMHELTNVLTGPGNATRINALAHAPRPHLAEEQARALAETLVRGAGARSAPFLSGMDGSGPR